MSRDERRQLLKDQLLNLGYPWPDHLEDKNLSWLEAEIRALKPPAAGKGSNDNSTLP
jgi:hypothetical protein